MMMNTSSNSDSDLTNQMELIQHACSLNNAGAAYMASNNGGQGVKFLKKALIIMEGISREEESDIIMAPSDGIAHFPFVEIPGLEEDEDTFYVYNRALVLDPPSDVSMTDLVFLNASILFNLALAFHQHGKVRCQEPMLRKAINLYDLAARLIEDLSSSYGALVVAALNNQAHIHRELCNFQDASQLLQQVHFLSGQVPEPPMEDSSSSAFTAALFDEIFLNITMASDPNHSRFCMIEASKQAQTSRNVPGTLLSQALCSPRARENKAIKEAVLATDLLLPYYLSRT